jgi:phosphoglycolate phosphatase
MSYKYILFDLDGTLTDPKIGITKSVAYSLKKLKNIEVELDQLTKFIGPPLKDSYIDFYGFSESEAEIAIQTYREYFKDTGIYENEVYSGMEDLLEALKDKQYILGVATSKPTMFAEIIIKHFDLERYFSCVVGSNLDGTRTDKAEVIAEALTQLSIDDKENVVMIGDRKHDILGAKKMEIDSIGVTYGYGSYEELEDAGADYIIENIDGLKKILEIE